MGRRGMRPAVAEFDRRGVLRAAVRAVHAHGDAVAAGALLHHAPDADGVVQLSAAALGIGGSIVEHPREYGLGGGLQDVVADARAVAARRAQKIGHARHIVAQFHAALDLQAHASASSQQTHVQATRV